MLAGIELAPIRPEEFSLLAAQHLLNRAGFGGTPGQIRSLFEMGLEKAVDHLVDYHKIDSGLSAEPEPSADIIKPLYGDERIKLLMARRKNDLAAQAQFRAERIRQEKDDREQLRGLERWWLSRMVATPRPLEEKLTLFWHGHFASNHRTVKDSYLLYKQNAFFRKNAAGGFADLAAGIIRDPAMIAFLDNNTNRKSHPNENLARELMELFTLGVGNYSENDIKEGARALTGFTYRDNDFMYVERQHDNGMKAILGKRGRFAGDDFVKVLLSRPACSRFIAYKLYRYFVTDVAAMEDLTPVEKRYVDALSEVLREVNYQLRPVLKKMFKSRHFYDAAGVVKSPVQLVVGTIRTLNTPVRDMGVVMGAMNLMGQKLFDPPSVAGWDGGRSWINSSTLFVRQNLCVYLLTGQAAGGDGRGSRERGYDPMFLVEGMGTRTPETVVNHLMAGLLGRQVHAQRREELIALLRDKKAEITADTVLALLMLITAMPEYQLC